MNQDLKEAPQGIEYLGLLQVQLQLESKGFRLSRTKTEYMRCDFGTTTREEEDISLEGQVVPRKDTFRYLGSIL